MTSDKITLIMMLILLPFAIWDICQICGAVLWFRYRRRLIKTLIRGLDFQARYEAYRRVAK